MNIRSFKSVVLFQRFTKKDVSPTMLVLFFNEYWHDSSYYSFQNSSRTIVVMWPYEKQSSKIIYKKFHLY